MNVFCKFLFERCIHTQVRIVCACTCMCARMRACVCVRARATGGQVSTLLQCVAVCVAVRCVAVCVAESQRANWHRNGQVSPHICSVCCSVLQAQPRIFTHVHMSSHETSKSLKSTLRKESVRKIRKKSVCNENIFSYPSILRILKPLKEPLDLHPAKSLCTILKKS